MLNVNLFYYTNQRRETMTIKQLVQGCYTAAWVGIEPTTFEVLFPLSHVALI